MTQYNIISQGNESTVVTEYTPVIRRSDAFQSEAELENEFIRLLCEQGYERLYIHTEDELISNLRTQIQKLNKFDFTDSEWDYFFRTFLANANEGIVEKTRTIQEDYIKPTKLDDGSTKNIRLIDKDNIHNNSLQVLNQYEAEGNRKNRYDVTVLVNGLPLVHIELKRRGVAIREAFNQIERYQRDSFWSGQGLFEYVQIFVISNGTHTKYYSNTTRFSHVQNRNGRSKSKTSNSFEFTSYWADSKNKVIPDLVDFTRTFMTKHTLLNIITKYCVFTVDDLLLVMRPYQIAATEKILNKIQISTNYKIFSTPAAGGYVWHTTGSGKTLTSFKTAQLATKLDYIDKVLFVVDRKDLDYQTMKEYDKFKKGAANSNKSTAILKAQIEDSETRIIITTIQKLDIYCKQNKGSEAFNKHIVLIFDECHRSQFGEFHANITSSFKKYHLFGFTGTPIFAENAGSITLSKGFVDKNGIVLKTTPQVFGECLHDYTIINAINDENVLPFKVDYIQTIKEKEIKDKDVSDIDRERALKDPRRISEVVSYILEHFDQKTKRNADTYVHSLISNVSDVAIKQALEEREKKRIRGFNSIFATASIEFAKLYYSEFRKQLKDSEKPLKVALIYSYGANDEVGDFVEDENSDDTDGLNVSDRDFLEDAIKDYNLMFHTNYDTSSDRFQNYYKDVSMRMKNQQIDILIVVNMFLTGFDATTLNTLWVDKNLKYHGLLQAFSRTNRILNSIKTFGNIVCFRNLEKATDEALALFSDKEAGGIILLRSYKDYFEGFDDNGRHFEGYLEIVDRLLKEFPLSTWQENVVGEKAEKTFIRLMGVLLKLRNILTAFDEFEDILTPITLQDYLSKYNDLYDKYRRKSDDEKEIINDDIVFEVELVKQIEVNIDYILALIAKKRKEGATNKQIVASLNSAMNSSFALRSKIKLIENFIETLGGEDVRASWETYIKQKIVDDLEEIIQSENLNAAETYQFTHDSLENGRFDTSGTAMNQILPPMSRFNKNRASVKERVIEKLREFFDRYWDLGINVNDKGGFEQ